MNSKIGRIYEIVVYSIIIIALSISIFYVINNQFESIDLIFKIILIPFILCFLYTLGMIISLLFHNDKFKNVFLKSYVITFLLFWFSFFGFAAYSAIKDGQFIFLLFVIPFILVGIYIFNDYLIKNK